VTARDKSRSYLNNTEKTQNFTPSLYFTPRALHPQSCIQSDMQSIDIAPQSTMYLSDVGSDHTLYAPSRFFGHSICLLTSIHIAFLITMRARLPTTSMAFQ